MGSIHIIRDFYSYPESRVRTLRIFTPDACDLDADRRFPVLYMHDGQNVFSHPESAVFHTWCANTTMEQLSKGGEIDPWIIVGIDHGIDRFGECSPWDDSRFGVTGHGDSYAEFIVDHLKPFIDKTYRTLPEPHNTATMGASLGGLLSLYLGLTRPQVFGRIGAVSPSVMWCMGRLFQEWRVHTRQWTRIWLDSGDQEIVWWDRHRLDYAGSVKAFYDHLRALGYVDWEVRLFLELGANHHEIDWQRRLPEIFRWLLK